MLKTLICLNYIYLQLKALSLKKDLTATKQSFIFITYRRYCKDIKGEASKIRLAYIAILLVLYKVKVFMLFKLKLVCVQIFIKAIN